MWPLEGAKEWWWKCRCGCATALLEPVATRNRHTHQGLVGKALGAKVEAMMEWEVKAMVQPRQGL